MKKLSDYRNERLKNPLEAKAYINAALEEYFYDHNKEMFLIALKEVINAQGGITEIAKKTNISRQHLYKILTSKGNPTLDKIESLLSVLGFRLTIDLNEKASKIA